MDFLQLDQRISNCLKEGHFTEAEQELRRARAQASEEGDKYALEHILSSFVELYCLMQPPRPHEAESYCLELEQLTRTAYSKLRTAMMFYWCMHDPARSIAKAQEALSAATEEHDSKTLYQSLGLSGLALLDLARTKEAVQILFEIEKVVAARQPIVVGDETLFLERLSEHAKDSGTTTAIQRIAKTLWPVCRDPQFAQRRKALART